MNIIPVLGEVVFEVCIMPSSGEFEVVESGSCVVSGKVSSPSDEEPVLILPPHEARTVTRNDGASLPLTSSDIYKELRLRGYDYGPTFQGILSASNVGEDGHLLWNGQWVSFLDTLLQIQVRNFATQLKKLLMYTTSTQSLHSWLFKQFCISLKYE